MRKNIKTILDAFSAGQRASDKTCHTDGTTVWSYGLAIARRLDDGTIAIRKSYSTRTTQGQINACLATFPDAHVVDLIVS